MLTADSFFQKSVSVPNASQDCWAERVGTQLAFRQLFNNRFRFPHVFGSHYRMHRNKTCRILTIVIVPCTRRWATFGIMPYSVSYSWASPGVQKLRPRKNYTKALFGQVLYLTSVIQYLYITERFRFGISVTFCPPISSTSAFLVWGNCNFLSSPEHFLYIKRNFLR